MDQETHKRDERQAVGAVVFLTLLTALCWGIYCFEELCILIHGGGQ